jgi:N-methylhydantoinase B
VALEAGEGFLVEVGGGGGFWDPLERAPEKVLADVRSGYVSLEAARRDYGVIIHQDGRRFAVDVEATKAQRQRMVSD